MLYHPRTLVMRLVTLVHGDKDPLGNMATDDKRDLHRFSSMNGRWGTNLMTTYLSSIS